MNDRITDPAKAALIAADIERFGKWQREQSALKGRDPEYLRVMIAEEIRRQMDERLGQPDGDLARQRILDNTDRLLLRRGIASER